MMFRCGYFIAIVLLFAFASGEEVASESSTAKASTEDRKSVEDQLKEHANPGQQTRKDLHNVAGIMLEQVGLPFFSWPTFGFIKGAAKTLLGVGKSNKRPAYDDEEYDYEQASSQTKEKTGKLKKAQ